MIFDFIFFLPIRVCILGNISSVIVIGKFDGFYFSVVRRKILGLRSYGMVLVESAVVENCAFFRCRDDKYRHLQHVGYFFKVESQSTD